MTPSEKLARAREALEDVRDELSYKHVSLSLNVPKAKRIVEKALALLDEPDAAEERPLLSGEEIKRLKTEGDALRKEIERRTAPMKRGPFTPTAGVPQDTQRAVTDPSSHRDTPPATTEECRSTHASDLCRIERRTMLKRLRELESHLADERGEVDHLHGMFEKYREDLATANDRIRELEELNASIARTSFKAGMAEQARAEQLEQDLATERAAHEKTREQQKLDKQSAEAFNKWFQDEKAAHEKTKAELKDANYWKTEHAKEVVAHRSLSHETTKRIDDERHQVHTRIADLERQLADERAKREAAEKQIDEYEDNDYLLLEIARLERALAEANAARETAEHNLAVLGDAGRQWVEAAESARAWAKLWKHRAKVWRDKDSIGGKLASDSLKRMQAELDEANAAREKVEEDAAAMREALQVAADWIEHPDHHEDECPGDCDGHASMWMVNKALLADAGRRLMAQLTQERERRERAEAQVEKDLRRLQEDLSWQERAERAEARVKEISERSNRIVSELRSERNSAKALASDIEAERAEYDGYLSRIAEMLGDKGCNYSTVPGKVEELVHRRESLSK